MSDPLLSVVMFAYNQERFVRAAVLSLLEQSYSPLEIILSDDASDDRTFEIIMEEVGAYGGPHTVRVNRNAVNLGVGEHVNCLMKLAQGELIVAAAADDISEPHRVESLYQAYIESDRSAMSVHSGCRLIDRWDNEIGFGQDFERFEICLLDVVERGTRIYGCTHAWHRNVFEKFGPLPSAIQQEDEVIPFRSLLLGGIAYVREPLVRYRIHDKNISRVREIDSSDTATVDALEEAGWSKDLEIARSNLHDLRSGIGTLNDDARNELEHALLKSIAGHEIEVYVRSRSGQGGISLLYRALRYRVTPKRLVKLLLSLPNQRLYSFIRNRWRLVDWSQRKT